jgi:hypothetical protein
MDRDETHDAACKWAFRKTFRRRPTRDELRDYKLALDERDRLGLNDALPIFSRLRSEAGPAPEAGRPARRRKAPRRRASSARTRASVLLHEQLKAGQKPGALVEAVAEKADIAKAELIRATDALGVRYRRGQWWLPG